MGERRNRKEVKNEKGIDKGCIRGRQVTKETGSMRKQEKVEKIRKA